MNVSDVQSFDAKIVTQIPRWWRYIHLVSQQHFFDTWCQITLEEQLAGKKCSKRPALLRLKVSKYVWPQCYRVEGFEKCVESQNKIAPKRALLQQCDVSPWYIHSYFIWIVSHSALFRNPGIQEIEVSTNYMVYGYSDYGGSQVDVIVAHNWRDSRSPISSFHPPKKPWHMESIHWKLRTMMLVGKPFGTAVFHGRMPVCAWVLAAMPSSKASEHWDSAPHYWMRWDRQARSLKQMARACMQLSVILEGPNQKIESLDAQTRWPHRSSW